MARLPKRSQGTERSTAVIEGQTVPHRHGPNGQESSDERKLGPHQRDLGLSRRWLVCQTVSQTGGRYVPETNTSFAYLPDCDEMLLKLERERDLLTSRKSLPVESEAFATADCQEIIEPYDEEEERQWRERHKQKEREHRQKLAELRSARKSEVVTEDDLLHLLDTLDLEEEVEDELDRMNEDLKEESDEEDSNDESQSGPSSESETEMKVGKTKPLKRRVSFKEEKENDREENNESDTSNDDSLIKIVFKHSDILPAAKTELGDNIGSPADIYTKYQKQRIPKSILKPSSSKEPCMSEDDDDFIQFSRVVDPSEDTSSHEAPDLPSEPVVKAVGEVVEHVPVTSAALTSDRPVSRFKAARIANKR
uniref:Uncharacterized protein n=1 Tax=Graphocephala atropunctata TaxID=36148 RepID=A0A1B6MB07_9HEMI